MRMLGWICLTPFAVLLDASAPTQDLTLADAPPSWNDVGATNAPAPVLGGQLDLDPPTAKDIKDCLSRVRDFCVRSTPMRLVDARTGLVITDRSKPIPTATLDRDALEFGEWSGEMSLVHSGLILASAATGDASYRNHTVKSLDFLFDGLAFVRQADRDSGLKRDAFHRMLAPRDLSECAMTAVLLRLDESLSLQAVQMISDHPERQVRQPFDLPEVDAWILDYEIIHSLSCLQFRPVH